MEVCEWCGKSYDPEEAEEEFFDEITSVSYPENLKKCLCGKCAIEAFFDEVDGVFYEKCEKCGKEFDIMEAKGDFYNYTEDADIFDIWNEYGNLCADCSIDAAEEYFAGPDD